MGDLPMEPGIEPKFTGSKKLKPWTGAVLLGTAQNRPIWSDLGDSFCSSLVLLHGKEQGYRFRWTSPEPILAGPSMV